ncbi:MAG: hypothetical protein RL154_278 [Pseudomonadota bacterium]|jgi:hypothetical protein
MDLATIKEMSSQWNLLIYDSNNIPIKNIEYWCNCFKKIDSALDEETMLHKMNNDHFDVFIIDSKMFNTYIEKTFEKLRHDYPHIGLIISTAEIDIFPLRDIINFGIDGLLLKPLVKNNFFTIMHKAMTKVFDRVLFKNYVSTLESDYCKFSVSCKNSDNTSKEVKNEIIGKSHEQENSQDNDFEVILPQTTHYAKIDFQVEHLDFYNTIAYEDVDEMIDLLSIMESTLGNIFSKKNSIDIHALQKLATSLTRFGSTLMHYNLYSDIGASIVRLSQDMPPNTALIQTNRPYINEVFYALVGVLQTFVHEVFEKHVSNPIVFNESIQNDISMIVEMIVPAKEEDNGGELFFF